MKIDKRKAGKPLVSVIITNYNYGQYITKAAESVLSQTYPNIELIIINDGSTDDSDEVIKKIINKNPGKNIKYINRENMGVVYTRNEGLELAKGEYVCYLDADDYFNRSYISKSYRVAKEYKADVVYPNWHFVGDWLGRPDTNFPEFSLEGLQLQKLHCTPASLIRKEAIGDHRFEVEKVAEDWDFFIGLSLKGVNFKLAKDNFINYRIRQGTRSSRYDPRDDTLHFVEILEKYKDKYGDKVIDPKKLIRLRHPNIVMKVLSMRYPRTIAESISKDGVKATGAKIVRKIVSRSLWIWKISRYTKNRSYQKSLKSLNMSQSPGTKLAVIIHLYYSDLWPVIESRLKSINIPFDLFVSVQSKDAGIELDRVNKYHKLTNIVSLPNRGRDVLPFMVISSEISKSGQYQYLLKLHSKKSPHRNDGNEWLDSLLNELIPPDISGIIKTLKRRDTGSIGPSDHIVSLNKYMGGNRERIRVILGQVSSRKVVDEVLKRPSRYPFFGGTMFWCRLDYLSPLLESDITPADFNSEGGQVDSTTAHAIERVLGRALHSATDKKMYIIDGGTVRELPDKPYNSSYRYVS